jgi:hypothetical protein
MIRSSWSVAGAHAGFLVGFIAGGGGAALTGGGAVAAPAAATLVGSAGAALGGATGLLVGNAIVAALSEPRFFCRRGGGDDEWGFEEVEDRMGGNQRENAQAREAAKRERLSLDQWGKRP